MRAEIVWVQRRTDEQRGIFAGKPYPDNPLPIWWAEAECGNCSDCGEADTELEARRIARSRASERFERLSKGR
jgi:hypothetical protein